MRLPGQKPPRLSGSDLRNRLQAIRDMASELDSDEGSSPQVKKLCYMIDYLALIVGKHFETGEV